MCKKSEDQKEKEEGKIKLPIQPNLLEIKIQTPFYNNNKKNIK
jgi:hypothetical protein